MDKIQQTPAELQVPVETYESLAGILELTLLSPALGDDDIHQGCQLAREYGVAAVVVRPCDAAMALRAIGSAAVKVASVVGYPYGISTTAAKLYEGRDLLRIGVRELDFVLNPSSMISRQFQQVEMELMQIVQSAHESDCNLTVVVNNRVLPDDLKIIATRISKRVEADAIGVQHSEADLTLIKPLLKDLIRIKRSDAVASLEDALLSRDAGYSRITTPNVAPILDAWKTTLAEQAKQKSVT